MDPRLLVVLVLFSALVINVSGNLVFPVSHKFNGRHEATVRELKAHDERRHARLLGASQDPVDVVLGGNGHPNSIGLYYTKIGIGNPSNDYFLQVDTGSDLLWVNGAECGNNCPQYSDIPGVKLTKYNRNSSSTAKVVTCDDKMCPHPKTGEKPPCKAGGECQYHLVYGDGSTTTGYHVKDDVHFQKATGNMQTSSGSAPIVFGVGVKQAGGLDKPAVAVSGLIGFGQGNTSILSQLAAAGKVRHKFAHCLDNEEKSGGGVWAIGEVVEPKMKNTSPMVPNKTHYNAVLEKIEVGSDVLKLPSSGVLDDLFSSSKKSSSDQNMAIFDSGTTLIYVPEDLYEQIEKKVFAKAPGLKLHKIHDQFICFDDSEKGIKRDEVFPIIKFSFKNSASLWVYPHDYLFNLKGSKWCHGFVKSKAKAEASIILGDMALSNKVVVYDLEKMVLGWTDHNCSSSIKVRDDKSGSDYAIQYHNISDASCLRLLTPLVLLVTAAATATAMLQVISI